MTAVSVYAAMTEMTQLFLNVWGSAANVEMPNKPLSAPASSADTWAKFSLEHTDRGQSTLANVSGNKRFTATGVGVIELYFPLGAGLEVSHPMAESVLKAYEGKRTASDVWFRDVTLVERDPRGTNPPSQRTWYQVDVVFLFTYDQLN